MSIKSMTGFARAEGAHEGAAWHWEVRSVNGRGLDVRLRLPPGSELLEPKVREAVARPRDARQRHHQPASSAATPAAEIRLNERALAQVMRRRRAHPRISPTRRRRASTA